MDFGDTQLIFEVRGLKTGDYHGEKVGNIVHLEEGDRSPARASSTPRGSDEGAGRAAAEGRRRAAGRAKTATSATSSPPSAAARSTTSTPTSSKATTPPPSATWPTSRTASASNVPFNSQTKAFGDNKEAYETLARMEEHLAKDNGLKLDGLEYRLGRKLTVDAEVGVVRRRPRGQQAPDPPLPQAVRRAREDRLTNLEITKSQTTQRPPAHRVSPMCRRPSSSTRSLRGRLCPRRSTTISSRLLVCPLSFSLFPFPSVFLRSPIRRVPSSVAPCQAVYRTFMMGALNAPS